MNDNAASLNNLSQRYEQSTSSEYHSKEEIISAIKRELSTIEEKQEKLKIRELLLQNELQIYNQR